MVLRRQIDSEPDFPTPSAGLDVLLVILSLLLVAMCAYSFHMVAFLTKLGNFLEQPLNVRRLATSPKTSALGTPH